MRERELHAFIRARIESELGRRSWSWLARQARVPRSTLSYEKERPRFSLKVLIRVSQALNCELAELLPPDLDDDFLAD